MASQSSEKLNLQYVWSYNLSCMLHQPGRAGIVFSLIVSTAVGFLRSCQISSVSLCFRRISFLVSSHCEGEVGIIDGDVCDKEWHSDDGSEEVDVADADEEERC